MSKFLNISTDNTLGGSGASDEVVSSQKAIKDYADGIAGSKTLTGLTDVVINNPSAGQNLTYDAQNQIWKNTSTSATIAWGGITGTLSDQTDLQNALNAKYDTSNPSGYTSNVGTVTSVNNNLPDANGNVTISTGGSYTAGTGIDITSGVISVISPTLTNTANQSSSLAIIGTIGTLYTNCCVIGYNAQSSGSSSTVIGSNASCSTSGGIAIGYNAKSTAIYNIQLGYGTNSEANSFYVATSSSNNWKMLGSDGTIPDARISSNIARTSDIPTVNNATLTITQGGTSKGTFTANASSDVTIALDAGGSVDVDNKSITTNASDQIQTVGVINSRDSSTAIKTWTGTKAQYDAIVSKDANTLYNITDDTDVSLTILEALYPVGSTYTTTANTCPLANLISGSTWVEETCRILVEKSVSGTEWYNLYSDGWCEQGGRNTVSGDGTYTVYLLKQYIDTNYTITQWSGLKSTYSNQYNNGVSLTAINSDSFSYNSYDYNNTLFWQACGYTSTTTSHKRFRRTA